MLRLLYNFSRFKSRMNAANHPLIAITPSEQHIFDLLLKFRHDQKLETVIRVAGGWVRDKIMGRQSHDIDFALDNIDGQTFTLLLKQYCSNNPQHKVSGFGVTKLNPQQSKNLKTATVKINEHMIDIVNLRSERYTEDSRIPEMEMGTPSEDALRRDLTINALFYNVVTKQVEDWTGQGLDDIKNGIIRTPLDPYVTFKDDPLRILRAFRFAGRYNYKIQPQIFEAANRKDIQQFLKMKVSKERVGIQLAGMLRGPNPDVCMGHIMECGLWNIVFQVPEGATLTDPAVMAGIPERSLIILKNVQDNLKTFSLEVIRSTMAPEEEQKNKSRPDMTEEELRYLILLSALTFVYQSQLVKLPKGAPVPLIEYIIKNSLKRSNQEALIPLRVNDSAANLLSLLNQKDNKLIQWLLTAGDKWEVAIMLAISSSPEHKSELLKIQQHIINNKLGQIYQKEPLVDGSFLTKQLGKKGKAVGVILRNVLIWGILNPGSTEQQLVELLKENAEKFEDPNMFD